MQSIVLSALGSLLAIVAVYALYIGSAEYCKSHRAMAECWWLKDARSFRFSNPRARRGCSCGASFEV